MTLHHGLPRRIVIVGASLAGLRAGEGLRRHGFDGELVLVGEEGRLPYDRPPLSKAFLAGSVDESGLSLRTLEPFDSLRFALQLGARASALHLDDHTVVVEGTELGYDQLLIATGASPRNLPGTGDQSVAMTLRTLDDTLALRSHLERPHCRLVVVGGGFLGMEIASTATTYRASVTVVEPLETPLGRVLGRKVGNALLAEHLQHGVRVITGVGVDRIVGPLGAGEVELGTGEVLEADVVVVAIGVSPSTDWLNDSGLSLDNGVVCDEFLNAAPDVFAAGDVARFPLRLADGLVRLEHWTNVAEQGRYLGGSMLALPGERAPFHAVPYFWSDHFGLKIQAIGLPQPDDEITVVDGSIEERRFVACYGRGGKLRGVVGFSRPRQVMAFRPLLERDASFEEALAFEIP